MVSQVSSSRHRRESPDASSSRSIVPSSTELRSSSLSVARLPDIKDLSLDSKLVHMACAGDRQAFEALVRNYYPVIKSFCVQIVGSTSAHDIAQETFIRAYRRVETFDLRKDFKSWLFGIARNCCRDLLRRDSKQRTRTNTVSDTSTETACYVYEPPDITPRPFDVVSLRDERRDAASKLALVSAHHQEILQLEGRGLSYKAIAAALEIPLGTVKSRLHAARLEYAEICGVLLKDGVEKPISLS